MKAVVLRQIGEVAVEDVPDPRLTDPGGAIVRVTATSICGSDLHLLHGTVPCVPGVPVGHECIGVVEEVGAEVVRFRRGDRVLVPAVVGCGSCPECRRDYVVGCRRFLNKVLGLTPELPGAQAEAVAIPAADHNLRRRPQDLDDETALLLTDVLPTGQQAVDQAGVAVGDVVVVLGCGPIGLAAILCASLRRPSRLVAIDPVAERRAFAASLGAETVDPGSEEAGERVRRMTEGQGADVVIEAVGRVETVRQAFDLVRIGGRVSVLGVLLRDDFPFPLATAFLRDVRFHTGLVNAGARLEELLPAVREGRLSVRGFFSHEFPLAEAVTAWAHFDGRRDACRKVLLRP